MTQYSSILSHVFAMPLWGPVSRQQTQSKHWNGFAGKQLNSKVRGTDVSGHNGKVGGTGWQESR